MELILGKNLYQVHISGGGKAEYKHEYTRIPFQLDWPKEVSDQYPPELLEMIKQMIDFVSSIRFCSPLYHIFFPLSQDPQKRPTAKNCLDRPFIREFARQHGLEPDPPLMS